MAGGGAPLHWRQIRAEVERLVTEAITVRGLTQETIAQTGGLSKQNYVSKILNLSDASLGPHLTNFLKLLRGVGVTKASEFFARVEQRAGTKAKRRGRSHNAPR